MILIIVQDNISFELSTIIVQIFSFGKESFAESYLQELYFIYAIIFSFLIEIFSKIFKRKLIITLKLKMILANLSLIISYFIAIILFTIFYKFDLVVLFFLLFFSLIYASIVILISHFLSYIKKLF